MQTFNQDISNKAQFQGAVTEQVPGRTPAKEELDNDEDWDLIIKPKVSLFRLNLKEVWQYRDLIKLWVRREYVGAFKQTLLGPMWHFISPIFNTVIFMFVFGRIAKLPTDGIPMFLFYNAGLAVWNLFNGSFFSASGAFLNNAGIFGKVYFPRLAMPLASIFSTFIKFGIQFGLLVVIYLYFVLFDNYQPAVGWGILLLPVSLILAAGIGLGMGLIISAVTTKYRDLNQLVGIAIQLLMYASPVIFSYESLEPTIQKWVILNPLLSVVESFRYAVFGTGYVSPGTLIYSFIFMIVTILVGIVLFNKAERNFMDVV